ncbi:glycoside hydrolase family 99-like domain-containing protein [Sphingobacterium sp. UBA6645]|uniref:glycosyltransferase WbsX family protein n=1 Tax=Sphingobacterium sp. UBA6645 TaxID=1947511 RepID=UPI0025FA1743|nr:glycoside hydrolase family 99-like domain-containing protein [Sphingobacterium sp. UBA6645]
MSRTLSIAFYLPQFHPVKENNEWWGEGFTEWTNVGKAKKYFTSHYQPRVPKDLGYYDLRVPETRKAQAELAKEYGIDAFCYWHYWFGNGKRLLEKPLNAVLELGEPDFPFCLAWANESWKGFPHGLKNRNTLIEQTYPGEEDFVSHFYEMLPAFKDKRYLRIDNKLVFVIYKPLADKQISTFIEVWRKLAKENGLNDFFFIGHINESKIEVEDVLRLGFDAVNTVRLSEFGLALNSFPYRLYKYAERTILKLPRRYPFKKIMKYFINSDVDSRENVFPSVITGWDHTPRSGSDGLIFTGFEPEVFEEYLEDIFEVTKNKKNNIIFVKSWNEWAEGNYLEPDMKYGKAFLEVFKKIKTKYER